MAKSTSDFYDHETSRKARGDDGKRGAEGSAEEERTESKAEAKAEGDAPREDGNAKMADDRAAMFRRHEVERRDLHGSHRDDHRKMQDRHEKEIADMMAQHQAQMAAGNEAGGETPAAAAGA